MKYLLFIVKALLITVFISGGCHPENFSKFVVHKTEPRKYPFSGIGLVRENLKDTIEIFYSKATEQEGVNEVLTAQFATDTIVGMNESWVNIDFGEEFGKKAVYFSPPDYTEKGGQYFKICNRGKGVLNYFIVINYINYDKYNFLFPQTSRMDASLGHMFIYSIADTKNIYDILYPEEKYDKSQLTYLNNLYNGHDEEGNKLYFISNNDLNDNFPNYSSVLSRTTSINDFESTNKVDGKAFFYGKIYSGQCIFNSKNIGGFMIIGCFDSTGTDCRSRIYK